MKKILAFAALLIVLSACDDSEEINYSGTYVSVSVKTSSVRMFTKAGEVKKSGVLEKFLPEDIADDFFILSSPPDISGEISVEFLEDELVRYTEYGNDETRTLIKKNGIMYLEHNETGTIFVVGGQTFSFSNVVLYKPLYADTTPFAPGMGYEYAVDIKECIYLQPKGQEIRLPILSAYYKHTSLGGGSTSAVRLNNAFNNTGTKKLGSTDTLVVQQNYIVFRKQ